MRDHRCENCRFWEDDEPNEPATMEPIFPGSDLETLTKYGLCRRYPPDPCPPEGNHGWPVLNFDDWCGEWQSVIGLPSQEDAELLGKSINILKFPFRIKNALSDAWGHASINTVGELVGQSGDDLLERKNIGYASLHEIRGILVSFNLRLKGD